MYPIEIVIAWVDNERRPLRHPRECGPAMEAVVPARAADEHGRLGTADTEDITHEFGHILGCPESTSRRTASTSYPRVGRVATWGRVMNNPAGRALARNFEVIRQEAATLRGVARSGPRSHCGALSDDRAVAPAPGRASARACASTCGTTATRRPRCDGDHARPGSFEVVDEAHARAAGRRCRGL
jgi:hypothetical protein